VKAKIASRHLPHGSGDVGVHEGARPVHEVQEGVFIHPRGHRAAAEAGRGPAVGMECGPAAKGMTVCSEVGRSRSWTLRRSLAAGLAVRPSGARPFDGTTGGWVIPET
jgi:hypothetical protein